MLSVLNYARRYFKAVGNERGATAVEYGLMVALIAVAIVLVVGALGETLGGLFNDVNGYVGDAASAPVAVE